MTLEATDSVVGAIASRINVNLMNPSLVSVYTGEIPQVETQMPYLVVRWPKTDYNYTFEPNVYAEKPRILLSIYHSVLEEAEGGMRRIMSDLKDQQLPTILGATMQLYPEDMYARPEPSLNVGSLIIFSVTQVIQVWIARS